MAIEFLTKYCTLIGMGISLILVGFAVIFWFKIKNDKAKINEAEVNPEKLAKLKTKKTTPHLRILHVAKLIRDATTSFINTQYVYLGGAISIIAIWLVYKGVSLEMAGTLKGIVPIPMYFLPVALLLGAGISAIAGTVGMGIGTQANYKTACAATFGENKAFRIAYMGGAVSGISTMAASFFFFCLICLVTNFSSDFLVAYSLGATVGAVFAKTCGGIFTKAADIAADQVGKVEYGLEEDDPRNPAVIADNAGDNINEEYGAASDMNDSLIGAKLSPILLSITAMAGAYIYVPIFFIALGMIASLISILFIMNRDIGKNPTGALNLGNYITYALFALFSAGTMLLGVDWRIWLSSIIGLATGALVGITTDYFTNERYKPVQDSVKAATTSSATTILCGMKAGFFATIIPLAALALAIVGAYKLCEPINGLFGIAMAAIGTVSIIITTVTNDSTGPIYDNAKSIAEQGGLSDKTIERIDRGDSAGNIVKAIAKGFALIMGGMSLASLLATFHESAQIVAKASNITLDTTLSNPFVIAGMLLAAILPHAYSGFLIDSVVNIAQKLVGEVRKQFSNPDIMSGNHPPNYHKCITITAKSSLHSVIAPFLLTLGLTLFVRYAFGLDALSGFITAGVIVGLPMGIWMANAGGNQDNSKKCIEAGEQGGKGSPAHKNSVQGDTWGDPMKDTTGPAQNNVIYAMIIIAFNLL